MWNQKLHFIPLNVAIWLQDIRIVAEGDDELATGTRNIYSSNDSIYDNVEVSTSGKRLSSKAEDKKPKAETGFRWDSVWHRTWPLRKCQTRSHMRSLMELHPDGEARAGFCVKDVDGTIDFNFPRNTVSNVERDITDGRRDLGETRRQEEEEPKLRASMSNLLARHREKHTQECSWTWLNAKEIILSDLTNEDDRFFDNDGNKNIAFLNGDREDNREVHTKGLPDSVASLSGWTLNSTFDSEFVTEKPPVPPKRRKRKMSRRNSAQTIAQNRRLRKAHLAKAKAVPIPVIQLRKKDCGYSKKELTPCFALETSAQNESEDNEGKKPLPFPAYDPELEYEISELLMMQRVTESSKERRRISVESKPPILDESNDIFQGCAKNIPGAPPLCIRSPCKSDREKMSEDDLIEFISRLSRDGVDTEGNDKVRQFLESRRKKQQFRTKPKIALKLREDIIIDWENDYENLSEPVLLEGKSVTVKRFPGLQATGESDCQSIATSTSKDCSDDEIYYRAVESSDITNDEISSLISDTSTPSQSNLMLEDSRRSFRKRSEKVPAEVTEIVALYDKILKESDPKCDTEMSDKISFSSVSDGFNSYSDFESDINETIAIGEIWYNEKLTEESGSIFSWDASEGGFDLRVDDDSDSWKLCTSRIEHKFDTNAFSELDTIAEDEDKISCAEVEEKKLELGKSLSDTNLLGKRSLERSSFTKSMDFFRDSLTEDRLGMRCNLEKRDSITSDLCEWMAKIRGIAFAEDQLFTKDEEWILSFDSEERAYFFEETSKKSLWALPDYSKEETKPEFNYPIQRSATESAINNEASTKLRLSKDGSQARISSTRSSKAQSMLIDPKLDLSPKDGTKTFSMPRDLSKIYGEIIRIGVLNKTKILENGKKLRKNWTPSFIVLTDSYLFFFKDAKSFQNMKNVIGPNANHMCLSLQGAVIEKGDKISSRKNVYKISCSDNTDVLIQTDKGSDAEEWFKEISSVIQKLPQDHTARGSPLLDSKSPSKVGRTKSLKVRSKDTGSMEDLSSTPEERQNKIKARLKKFFIRRPTVDSLKKKGIWKDEPVFGCSLEQITKNRNPRVPVFVEKCIEYIESKEENLKTDGLYRASGNLSQVQKIRLEVDQNNLNIMKDEEDVHVLTGSLKLFFRELKEPLIPSKQLEPALLATDKHTRKERIKDFQKIVKSLPTPNYDTLKFLLQHLLRVKEYHKFNRMNINNLAIVFGPTLMWPEQESANMALELMQQNVVIECLLKEFQEIFT